MTIGLSDSLSPGAPIVNTATVADDGTSGPDRTPADNRASDSTMVEAAPNAAPVAHDQQVETDENVAIDITLSATDADGDVLTYTIVDQPTRGTLSGTAPVLTYTPDDNVHGEDSFTFKVSDGSADSNVATVRVTVSDVNAAPVVDAGGPYTVAEGSMAPLAADGGDPDGDALTYKWDLDGDAALRRRANARPSRPWDVTDPHRTRRRCA